jgi:RNA polymerase-binding transcription factor DksA
MRVHPQLAPADARAGGHFPNHVLERIAADLEVAAAAREEQLKALPPATGPVAVAHRDSVLRILDAIRTAQAQLADGTYGDCRRCGGRADCAAAMSRPWAPLCDSCGRR